MSYSLIDTFRTETILSSVVPVLAAPNGYPVNGQDWITAYYLDGLPSFNEGDILMIQGQTQVRCDVTYNVQITTDVGLTDGWEASNVDDAQYRPCGATGSDLSQNPIHYAAITRTSGFWRVPGLIQNPCVQFRVSSASTAADGNGVCTILDGYGFLSVGLYRQ